MKNTKNDPSALVRAARHAAGDAHEDAKPLTKAETAAMDEVRRGSQRPSKAEIREEAKKLLK